MLLYIYMYELLKYADITDMQFQVPSSKFQFGPDQSYSQSKLYNGTWLIYDLLLQIIFLSGLLIVCKEPAFSTCSTLVRYGCEAIPLQR